MALVSAYMVVHMRYQDFCYCFYPLVSKFVQEHLFGLYGQEVFKSDIAVVYVAGSYQALEFFPVPSRGLSGCDLAVMFRDFVRFHQPWWLSCLTIANNPIIA